MSNEEGWIYALTRDLKSKTNECEELKKQLENKENKIRLLTKNVEELKRKLDRRSVEVEIRLTKAGQKRTYCGGCGHYVSNTDTFCRNCGTLNKW